MSEELPDSVVILPAGAVLYLVGEIERLKAHVESLDHRITELTGRQDEDCERIARDIAYDRQRLARLEAPADPTSSQKDRGEILRALLAAYGGKMAEKEARHHLKQRLMLVSLRRLFDLWVEHYDQISEEYRRLMPLRAVQFLAPEE